MSWSDRLFTAGVYLLFSVIAVAAGYGIMTLSYHLVFEFKSVVMQTFFVFTWFFGLGVATAPIGLPILARLER